MTFRNPLVLMLLLLAGLAAGPDVVSAQPCSPAAGGPPCEGAGGPASLGAADGLDLTVGNPFHPLTGNKYQEELDAAPEPGPLGLEIRRHYNAAYVAADSPAGRGWSLSYDTRLYRWASAVQIIQADGRRVAFDLRRASTRRADGGQVCAGEQPGQGRLIVAAEGAAGDRQSPSADRAAFVWQWPGGRELAFDARGFLVAIRQASDRADPPTVRLERDDAGRLVRVTDPRGRSMRLVHDADGHLERIEHPRGVWRYRIGAAGQVQAVTAPNGSQRRYGYDEPGFPSHVSAIWQVDAGTDRPKLLGRWAYDEAGRVARHLSAAGETLAMRYDVEPARGDERVNALTDEAGGQTLYRYRPIAGRLRPVAIEGPGCRACRHGNLGLRYDGEGRPLETIRIADPGRPRLRYRRDAQGRVERIERIDDGAGATAAGPRLVRRFEYADDASPRPSLIARPSVEPGREHRLQLDYLPSGAAAGRLAAITESGFSRGRAVARTVTFDYDADGRLAHVDGPLPGPGDRHAVVHEAGPDGRVQPVLIDALGRRLRVGDRSPARQRFDRLQLLPGFTVTAADFSYRAPNGATFRHDADDFGRTVRIESADAGVEWFDYDEADRVVRQGDSAGATVELRYDDLDRRLERTVRTPDGFVETTRYRHDGHGPIYVEHPVADERIRRDGQGRIVERAVTIHVGPRPQQVVTRFAYRGDDPDPVARRLPDGSWLHFGRTAAGAPRSIGWQPRASGPVQPIIALRDAGGAEAWVYGNGVSRDLSRDAAGRPATIVHRRPDAVVAGRELGYDAQGRIIRIEAPGREAPGREALGIESTGRKPLGIGQPSPAVTDLAYDRAGRLIIAQSPDATWWYAYDANGNRLATKRQAPPATQPLSAAPPGSAPGAEPLERRLSYVAGSNRLAGVAHDAAGRPVTWNGLRLAWHPGGQLARIESADGVIARYHYDHRGERVAKQVGDRWTYFLHEGGRLVAEWGDGAAGDAAPPGMSWVLHWQGNPIARLPLAPAIEPGPSTAAPDGPEPGVADSLPGRLLGTLDRWLGARPAVLYLHPDHLGTPIVATDAAGQVVWRNRLGPFGEALDPAPAPTEAASVSGRSAPDIRLRLRLPGQYHDAESGLHYNLHRYYDPAMGRYLTPDPMGLRAGGNSYAYAAGDPIRFSDPNGLLLFAFDGTLNGEDDETNVRLMWMLYGEQSGDPTWLRDENRRYQAGIGVRDDGDRNSVDAALARGWRERVDSQITNFYRAAERLQPGETLYIDVIGFSRGAVQARVFGQEVARAIRERRVQNGSQVVLRFMGLFDSVDTSMFESSKEADCQSSVSTEWQRVTHLVSLHERRNLFPALTIGGSDPDARRREIVLLGAHSDIGGGYMGSRERPTRRGDLSDVALWIMMAEAEKAGVEFKPLLAAQRVVSRPLLHDESAEDQLPAAARLVFREGRMLPLDQLRLEGIDEPTAARFIRPRVTNNPYLPPTTVAGTVDVAGYCGWVVSVGLLPRCPP